MAISIGINKVKTAVFISGKGSNLKSLIKFSKSNKSPISVKLIISNNSKAKGLGYGKIFRIKKRVINFRDNKVFDDKLITILRNNQIEMICLAGFMKILSKYFIKKFSGKIINIHPSLLPKYKGLNTHKRAIINRDKYSGCTVHFVNSKLDSGKIILQKKVKISKNETEKSLTKKILTQEHKLYPKAISKIFNL
jgi:phosphoribosylglycinamide formyltransferase-1